MTKRHSVTAHPHLTAFEAYLRDVRLFSPRTVGNYLRVAADLAAVLESPAQATEQQVSAFLGRGGSASTRAGRARWNLELAALRAYFGWTDTSGQRAGNPTVKLQRQRVQTEEVVPLSLPEMVRLVESVELHSPRNVRLRNVALVQVLMHTALRVSELVSLDVLQVDQQGHLLHGVRRKGNKIGAVAVNDVAMEAIENYLRERQCGRTEQLSGPLFVSQHGDRLAVRTVQDLIGGYAKKAGIARRITPHTLRHSSATQLSALGTPVRVIQEICAHTSLSTTQRYLHTGMTERHEAVARMARAFRAEQQVADDPQGA